MINKVIGILFLTCMATSSLVFYGIALCIWAITLPFDRRKRVLHQFTCFWASLYLWMMPAWKVRRYGLENLPSVDTPSVFVANHQSQLDILLGFTLFYPMKWVSKSEVFMVPFIGWNMSLNGYIKLRRGKTTGIKQMLKDMQKTLSKGSSVFLFPEGTRSPNGEVQKFRSGAFRVAQKMQVPIVPVAINGTAKALPKNSLQFTGTTEISLTVLEPIPYEKFADKSTDEVALMVETLIKKEVH